ncbi:helix-turn-helix domain-containing protein [Lysinibacillus sphaericus]|uniref:MerR family transcriptional regulator n=2 Tax=Lysinibacillus sphaericus OT4b.31 TaxID=1285586 RepID=R7ZIE5_LYSSH|nr:helix-turn-helix domain-containing protein [Lysinibacillus sphaericus]EON73831.1 MerR family transcriptional regulator [Lysinibacillus sphaericus OT4b.31]
MFIEVNLGETIKDSRKKKGMTMIELAEKAEITQGYLSKIENNLKIPKIDTLKTIGSILDIPIGELLIGAKYIDEWLEMFEENIKKPPSIPTFGEAIRVAREDNYDSNDEQLTIPLSVISKKINIPETTLEQIENGVDIPLTNVQLMELAKALDVTFAYLYLLAGKGNNLFEQNILNNILIQLRPLQHSSVKKFSSMTFEEFYELNKKLSNGSILEVEYAKSIYDSYIFANEIDQLMQLHAMSNPWRDSPDIQYLLNLPDVQINYRGRKLSPTDKQKILTKIEEMKDKFEYQD